MDNLESKVVGGKCGAPDWGDISKNGSNQVSNLYGVTLLDCHTAPCEQGG